ncbi:MAG: SHOCT domain-containing protein [Roseobacter sp.]
MTAILSELRALDARRDRSELSPEEYELQRASLLQNIEEAETHFVEKARPRRERRAKKSGSSAIGFGIVVCLGVMGMCIGLTLLFLPDLNLALTLGVTILAALSVALLRETGE